MDKKRRERILNYVKDIYFRMFKLRDLKRSKEEQFLFHQYMGFKAGVYMAHPHGKWEQAFNKIYEETRKEYDNAKLGGR